MQFKPTKCYFFFLKKRLINAIWKLTNYIVKELKLYTLYPKKLLYPKSYILNPILKKNIKKIKKNKKK